VIQRPTKYGPENEATKWSRKMELEKFLVENPKMSINKVSSLLIAAYSSAPKGIMKP
jgi:hypothetical protein